MRNFNQAKKHFRKIFILATALVIIVTLIVVLGIEFFLTGTKLIEIDMLDSSAIILGLVFIGATVLFGSFFSFIVGKLVFQPINELLDGLAKLSGGEYATRLEFEKNKSMQVVADGFNSLASELEHIEIMRSDFINNFSHEIKTPLVSIKGLIVLMKSGRVTREKQKEYLEIIEEEADRLTMMTTNILNLSKIQNQKIIVNKEVYNISEQIRGTLVAFEKRWSERGLSVIVDIGEEEVCAAEDLLRQVWTNLIDNAIKYADESSTIEIKAASMNGVLTVSVSNMGPEIPESDKEKIFRKFYQIDTASSRTGNGIGLSIVKSIVEMHCGTVEVESENGKTTFKVSLPVS